MIHDGYGDHPDTEGMTRDEILDQVLPGRRGWLYAVADGMTSPEDKDDLVQEGYIAMWRAIDTWDPSRGVPLAQYLQIRARYRMIDVRNGKRLTGAPEADRSQASGDVRGAEAREKIAAVLRANPKATGREIAAATGMVPSMVTYHRKRMGIDGPPPTYTSLEALLDEGFNPATADDVIDHMMRAYHRGVVMKALEVLTPAEKKYVTLRFWDGLSGAELTAVFGYNPGRLWTTAKQRLVPVLGHLVNA